VTAGRAMRRAAGRVDARGRVAVAVIGAYLVLAIAAPLLITPADLSAVGAPGAPHLPPSARFPLGTDVYGRSMLAVTVWGTRVSLTVGLSATAVAIGVGAVAGIVAGHFRGRLVAVLMHVTDWFLAMPTLVLAAVLTGVLRPGAGPVVLAIGLTSWPATARLVRAQTLVVEAQPHVDRAKVLGAGHWHVIRHHVLAAVAPLIVVQASLTVSAAVLTEATLAFLGQADPIVVSWGTTLQQARDAGSVSAGHWWILFPPGAAIVVLGLAFTECGRAVQRALRVGPWEHP